MKNIKKRSAFTLIEMTIVLFIISLLILIVVPNISGQRKHAESIHVNAMTTVIQSQVDAYLSDNSSDGLSMNTLVDKGYLTSRQANQAQQEGIKIVNNEAVKSQ
ncbi:competence type IV pilus major pilin ComGC [Apilactobacillus bombintestini]|uniref:Prepilin-type N-terminal cleavage/methylation domain-containing protein n=1 Tax=Apilactobacillus bombintestini TaxID=2419772 RepID=A0A387AVM9_9LACO|nr:competence type IV pilus major pilin ComGC [Apilactobacillus bombintestini]AYF92736.1 prepilin-type N-terminal cleavage/methylation domain-containing protein [Apilactobacillus bombintestini]